MPEGGRHSRGLYRPHEWSIPLRQETTCTRCGRPLVLWRDLDDPGNVARCNGPDKRECGAIVAARNEEIQRKEAQQNRLARMNTHQQAVEAAAARREAAWEERQARRQEQSLSEAQALAQRHRQRRWTCHRPDKVAHEGRDEAEVHMAGIRLASPATSRYLRVYLCRCTFWHVGNGKS